MRSPVGMDELLCTPRGGGTAQSPRGSHCPTAIFTVEMHYTWNGKQKNKKTKRQKNSTEKRGEGGGPGLAYYGLSLSSHA